MKTHDELALFEFLLKNEAFQRYRQKLEAMREMEEAKKQLPLEYK